MTRAFQAILTALLLLLAGCGYHTAQHSVRLPADIKTIAIPSFSNQTQAYRIEQILTAAVVREFDTRTNYHITSNPADADAVLRGTVLNTQVAPLTYDSTTGRASTALVTVTTRISLTDRKGNVLYQNPGYVFHEQYQISREISSFFEEDTPALDRLSREFAHTLVADVLEAF